MKNLFNLLNNMTEITKIINLSVPYEIKENNNEIHNEQTLKKFSSIINQFLDENKDLFKSITSKINSNKSSKKILESISEDEKEKICDILIEKYKKEELVNQETIEKIKNQKKEFKKQIFLKLRETLLSSNRLLKEEKRQINIETKSYYKRIVTDYKNKFAINDDGTENSKNIFEKIENFKSLLSVIENDIKPILNKIKNLKIASMIFKGGAAVAGILSAGFYVAIPFSGGATTAAALATSFAASLFGSTSTLLDLIINSIQEKHQHILKLIDEWKNIEDKSTIWLAYKSSIFGIKSSLNIFKFSKLISNSLDKISKNLSKALGFLAILGAGFNIYDLINDISNYKKFEEKMQNFTNFTEELVDTITKLKKVKWKVINESPLDKPYWKGGKGGTNLHFLNIETNEVKTLMEMLNYTNLELSTWGLTKIFSKRDGWYIRTLPNKYKFDNLG
ncbi:MAG: hypothetical protein ACTTJO_02385 [Metamycoplasmataceae bacterium]